MNFKAIHIGQLIEAMVEERQMNMSRICNFMKCREEEIEEMYQQEGLMTPLLLKWSKLLEYDFFRIYSQHLILYAPPVGLERKHIKKSLLPQFRKNIYTKEVIDFILEQIASEEMTKNQVISEYFIPRTTLYKWIEKYGKPRM